MPTDREMQIAEVMDEIKSNWLKWQEHVDQNCEFGAQVAAIMWDAEDDKQGRISDLIHQYAERCAKFAIDSGIWHGMQGNLKRAAGLNEPNPIHNEEYCRTDFKEAA